MANASNSSTAPWTSLLNERGNSMSSPLAPYPTSPPMTTALAIPATTTTSHSVAASTFASPKTRRSSKSSPIKKEASHAWVGKCIVQSIWDDDEMKKAIASDHHSNSHNQQQQLSQFGAATSTLAKFKAAQDLKIQTENLPESPKPKESNSASSSTFTTPGTDTSSAAATPKTPVPPSSTGKKRRRRTAAQIDRKFSCNYPGCPKAYGSEGSLTQHQRLKHRQQGADAASSAPNNQLGSFFLPLHRPGRSGGAAGYTRPPPSQSRTVSIRPAAMEGVMSPISFDMASSGMTDTTSDLLMGAHSLTEQLLSAANSGSAMPVKRQNLRSRSNSMPVSFSTPGSAPSKQTSGPSSSSSSTTRPATSRKNRASCTPRAKAASTSTSTNRRVKCRSKSETLSETGAGFLTFSDVKPPRSDRSVSDSFVSNHAASILMPLSSSSGRHSYDWSSSIASDSPSSDQAIDSDILSVLADCDSSDVGESSIDGYGGDDGPPLSSASSSYRSQHRSASFGGESSASGGGADVDMMAATGSSGMDYFGISEPASITLATVGGLRINDLFRRAERMESNAAAAAAASSHSHARNQQQHAASPAKRALDLDSFAIKSEPWASAAPPAPGSGSNRLDAGYLSTHMEKMSMIHPVPTPPSQSRESGGVDELVPLEIPTTTAAVGSMALHPPRVSSAASAVSSAATEESLPGAMSSLDQFASVSIESFSVKREPENDLVPESMDICEASEKESFVRMMQDEGTMSDAGDGDNNSSHHTNWILKHDSSSSSSSMYHGIPSMGMKSEHNQQQQQMQQQQMHWMKDFPSLSALEAQNQYVDELFQETMAAASRGSQQHEWKAQKLTASGSPRGASFSRGLPVPLGGEFNLFANESKHLGAFNGIGGGAAPLGDFLFDVSEYGLEDTRMGSPLLCQQEEL